MVHSLQAEFYTKLWNISSVLLTSSGAFEYFNIPLSRTKKRCKNQTTPVTVYILSYLKISQLWVNVAWHLATIDYLLVINMFDNFNVFGSVHLAPVRHIKW